MSKEAKFFVNVLFVGAAVGAGVYLSRGPWFAYQRQKAAADQATSQMNAAERDRADLLRRSADTESAAGRELIAREHGYLKPGEKPVNLAP